MEEKSIPKHIQEFSKKELILLLMSQKHTILDIINGIQDDINELKSKKNSDPEDHVCKEIFDKFIEQGKLSCLLDPLTSFFDDIIECDHNEFLKVQIEKLETTRKEIMEEE